MRKIVDSLFYILPLKGDAPCVVVSKMVHCITKHIINNS